MSDNYDKTEFQISIMSPEYKRRETRFKKEKELKNKFIKCIESYFSLHNITEYNITAELYKFKQICKAPDSYFVAIKDGLYLNNNNSLNFLHKPNIGFHCLNIPCSNTCQIELQLVRTMFNYIKYVTNRPSTYTAIIEDYIWKYSSKYNIDTIRQLYNFFDLNMGNLWYKNFKPFYCFENRPQLILLTDSFSKEFFNCYGLPLPNKSFRKSIFKRMKKEYSKDKDSSIYKEDIIYYFYNSIIYKVKYSNSKQKYYATSMPYSDYKFMSKSIPLTGLFYNVKIADKLVQFFYTLTNGSSKIFDTIATLLADIWVTGPTKHLNVIWVKPEIKESINRLLAFLTLNENYKYKNFKTLANDKIIYQLIENSPTNNNSIIIDQPERITDPFLIKRIKSLLKGTSISIHNDFMSNLYYKNDCSIITITHEYSLINNYTNNYKDINIINLSHLSSFEIPEFTSELSWIFIPLVLHGLNVIRKRNYNKKEKFTYDDIPTVFFKNFCEYKLDAEISDENLYAAYKEYCSSKYQDSPLSRTIFIKHILSILETYEEAKNIKHCRPHHSKHEPNIYAIKGLFLNKKKLQAALETKEVKALSSDYRSFYMYLEKLSDLVPDNLINE